MIMKYLFFSQDDKVALRLPSEPKIYIKHFKNTSGRAYSVGMDCYGIIARVASKPVMLG